MSGKSPAQHAHPLAARPDWYAQPLAARVDAVVIGTSAGGLEALGVLLPALRRGFGLPVVTVIHLPPREPSLLTRIFAPKCALAVREVEDKDPIETDTVYFAPPNYHLLFETRREFALSADDAVNYSRPSIDVLFESALEVFGARVMAVLLTGANQDGAKGLCAIRAAGGLTVVQDPATAAQSQMPRGALSNCDPDLVLPLSEIALLLRGADAVGGEA